MPNCPRCASEEVSKNGHRNGRQCWLCRVCGYQFTSLKYRERPVWEKILASLFYAVGVAPRDIARLFKISASSVQRWRVLGRARPGERDFSRSTPAVVDVSLLRPHLGPEAAGTDGERPIVLIMDGKREKIVGFIMPQD